MNAKNHAKAITKTSDKNVIFDIHDGVFVITLNRPESANSLNTEMCVTFEETVDHACRSDATRAILLSGTGKVFCAGGDINQFKNSVSELPEVLKSMLTPLNNAILKLASSGVPVITALNGAVGGGGIGLALCGDYVYAAESMKMRSGYTAIGLTPDAGSSWYLTQRVGPVRAKQIFLSNRTLSAQKCLDIGIVDALYPDDQLLERAYELAHELSTGPKDAFASVNALIHEIPQRSLFEQLNLELKSMVLAAETLDATAGISAFINKQKPKFEP